MKSHPLRICGPFWLALLVLFIVPGSSGCNDSRSGPVGISCGGPIATPCPVGMFCKLSDDCGGADKEGVCSPIPETCPKEDALVCTCENREFKSACYANGSGETVAYPGSCIR